MNKLTQIHTAYLNANIALKSYKQTSNNNILTGKHWELVETNINGEIKRWGDCEKNWIQDLCYDGTLDQCLAYLQSFAKNENFYKQTEIINGNN